MCRFFRPRDLAARSQVESKSCRHALSCLRICWQMAAVIRPLHVLPCAATAPAQQLLTPAAGAIYAGAASALELLAGLPLKAPILRSRDARSYLCLVSDLLVAVGSYTHPNIPSDHQAPSHLVASQMCARDSLDWGAWAMRGPMGPTAPPRFSAGNIRRGAVGFGHCMQ